jgi:hypothetical protein
MTRSIGVEGNDLVQVNRALWARPASRITLQLGPTAQPAIQASGFGLGSVGYLATLPAQGNGVGVLGSGHGCTTG